MLRALRLALLVALAAAWACGKGPAYGTDNAIIAVVDPALRDSLEPVIRRSFERTFLTTREESVFEVTFRSTEDLGEFRRWRRILVVDPAGGPLADDLLGRSQRDASRGGGIVTETRDRWARGQTVWVVSAADGPATLSLAVSSADSLFDAVYRHWVDAHVARMWASGRDEAHADSLAREIGFSITLPRVYRGAPADAPDSSRVWYNEDPRRVVSLHWTALPAVVTPDTVLALRRAWGAAVFAGDTIPARIPALNDTTAAALTDTTAPGAPLLLVGETTLDGRRAVRLQGVWQNATDRTAGVFLTYGVACGDRLVLLDGNVFAPDRPKLPFVVHLERVFETFRCAREP